MSANALKNKHVTRVYLDNGGDISTIDQTWLQTVCAWLVSEGLDKDLIHWVDPAFGCKFSSGTTISKIYDLGTTWLPIGGDLTVKPGSTGTTYSATGINSLIPAWVNASSSAHLYFGGGRYNDIFRRQQLTIAALYERTQTSTNIAFLGKSTSVSNLANLTVSGGPQYDGAAGVVPGISLIHTSGTPGSIEFNLKDGPSQTLKTASVTASGGTTQVAIGTVTASNSGTSMVAYSDGTAGTPVTSLQYDPFFAWDGALAGARGINLKRALVSCGSDQSYAAYAGSTMLPPYAAPTLTFVNNYAQFKCASLIVFGRGLDSTQAVSLNTLLTTRAASGTGSSVDIKANYSATGDGQLVTDTRAISTTTLTTGSSHFVSGDIGKLIAIQGAGNGSEPFMNAHKATIVTVPAANQVTITPAVSTALSGSTGYVEWGHDDTQAFRDFRDDALTEPVTLHIPDGRYLFADTGAGILYAGGYADFTQTGTTYALSDLLGTGCGYFLGSLSAQHQDQTHHSLLSANALVGATSFTVTSASPFTIGHYAIITGLETLASDSAGDGFPTDPQFFEYVRITNIVSNTITIDTPLRNTYKTTWPHYRTVDNSSEAYQGGPATLYAVRPEWVVNHTYNNAGIEQRSAQVNSKGHTIAFVGGYITDSGLFPSENIFWSATDVDASQAGGAVEVDKLIETATFSGGTWKGIHTQSAAINNLVIDGVTFTSSAISGTARNTTITNCTGSAVSFGPTSFGAGDAVIFQNNVFTSVGFGGAGENTVNTTGAYTMTGGVLTRAFSAGSAVPPNWAVPGHRCFWISGSKLRSFNVIDLTQSGTSFSIVTDEPGGFPTSLPGTDVFNVAVHPAPLFTASGNFGCAAAEAYNGSVARPLGTYWKKDYSGNIGTAQEFIYVVGRLISAKFNVTVPFTGTPTLLIGGIFNNANVLDAAGTSLVPWQVEINLAQVGERIITPAGRSGLQTGDVLPTLGAIWMLESQLQPYVSTSTSGGTINIEILTEEDLETAVVVLMPMGCM